MQELCQRDHRDLPIYTDEHQLGDGLWVSTVEAFDVKLKGDPFPSKKQSQQNAAHKLLQLLTNDSSPPQDYYEDRHNYNDVVTCQDRIAVLVDLENYPQMNTSVYLDTKFVNVDFFGFVGKCSSHAQKNLQKQYPFINVIIVDNTAKDAVDHFISMYLTYLIVDGPDSKYQRYIVITRDNFGACCVENSKQFAKGLGKSVLDAVHCVNGDQCYEYILSYSDSGLRDVAEAQNNSVVRKHYFHAVE